MSSTGANRESEGGTMKNVVDDPMHKPQVHNDADDKAQPNAAAQNNQQGAAQSQSKPTPTNNDTPQKK